MIRESWTNQLKITKFTIITTSGVTPIEVLKIESTVIETLLACI